MNKAVKICILHVFQRDTEIVLEIEIAISGENTDLGCGGKNGWEDW